MCKGGGMCGVMMHVCVTVVGCVGWWCMCKGGGICGVVMHV